MLLLRGHQKPYSDLVNLVARRDFASKRMPQVDGLVRGKRHQILIVLSNHQGCACAQYNMRMHRRWFDTRDQPRLLKKSSIPNNCCEPRPHMQSYIWAVFLRAHVLTEDPMYLTRGC